MGAMKRTTLLPVTVLAFVTLLAGCSSGGEGGLEPQERLAQAQATLESTEAITFDLTSADVPNSVNGVQAASGTGVIEGDLIKFEGEFQGQVGGVSATVSVLAIGDDTYMKLFTPAYEPVDLSTLGVPNPASFFAPDTGIASLLAATEDVAEGEQVREGNEVLTQITGTLAGEHILALLYIGSEAATFDVTYGLTEDNELRTAVVTGEFWAGSTSTYTMLLTDYGQVVPIERPS